VAEFRIKKIRPNKRDKRTEGGHSLAEADERKDGDVVGDADDRQDPEGDTEVLDVSELNDLT